MRQKHVCIRPDERIIQLGEDLRTRGRRELVFARSWHNLHRESELCEEIAMVQKRLSRGVLEGHGGCCGQRESVN